MLEARLWVKKNDKNFLGRGRIELLEHIKACGSIHAAAKVMKMSYKAAWDAVDAMNNLSDEPLVQKTSGGKGGGGTLITPKGEEIIQAFHTLESKHKQFLELFANSDDLTTIATNLSHLSLKLSARNQLMGIITDIQEDSVNVTLEITLKGKDKLYASITHSSFLNLGCQKGDAIIAIIKASSIQLSKEEPSSLYENIIHGKVIQLLQDSSGTEITLEMSSQSTLTATVPNDIFNTLNISLNDTVVAYVKASSIIVGV